MSGNMIGKVFDNRYELTERIGVGGMAEVYQGQDRVLGRRVAVKVMLPQYAQDEEFTQRFRQEAAAAANLQSPFIVNVYDWGQDGGTYYIVMEYVRGSDLKTAIKQRGAINQRKVAEIGAQVCQALSVAHNQDIVHRDIKPQNIMVQPDGNVKVMDFGIARAKNSMMSKTSAVLGTAHYISPEQAQGKELTAASDIYSLGVVLYEAATGALPFDGPDSVSVAMKQVSENPIPPTQVNPEIDPSLESVILRAMQKDPANRFATVGDMKHALNDFLAGRVVRVNNEPTALIPNYEYEAGHEPYTEAYAEPYTDDTTVMSTVPPNVVAPVNGAARTIVAESDEDIARRKRRRNVIIALVIVGLLAALAGGYYAWAHRTGVVPDVSGRTVENATVLIEDAGFTVGEKTEEFSTSVEAGKVISTDPAAGISASPGTRINLVVSKGRDQVAVPDLANKTAEEAKAALESAGLKASEGTAQYSDTVPANQVLSQNPAAGEMVDRGATITYVLSLGAESFEIPNVVGEGEGAATATLSNAGFNVEVGYENHDEVAQGLVISQTPAAGERLPKGATINITISSGPNTRHVSALVVDNTGAVTDAATVTFNSETVQNGGADSFWVNVATDYEIVSIVDSRGHDYSGNSSGTITDIREDVQLIVTITEKPQPEPSSSQQQQNQQQQQNTDGQNNTNGQQQQQQNNN